jgi:FkbM family methyltransferase
MEVGVEVGDLVRGSARMAQLALMRRELCLVTRDRSGGWRHRYTKGVLVTPAPRKRSWKLSERDTIDLFLHRYEPQEGDVVVELGAGCGTETVTLSRLVGPTGRVIACEAHPWTTELLRRTVEENGLENVVVRHVAVADTSGVLSLTDTDSSGSHRNTVMAGGDIEVPARSLDDLVAEEGLERIDLLKVNIEGAERLVVEGMDESVGIVRNAVISCHDFRADRGTGDDSFRTSAAVRGFLEGAGFRVSTRPDDPREWVRFYQYATRADPS